MSALDGVDPWMLQDLATELAHKVRVYFTDPEHRKEFEKWYEERYGKKYVWKRYGEE